MCAFWLVAFVLRRFSGNKIQLQRQELLNVPILEKQIRSDLHTRSDERSRKNDQNQLG